LLSFRALTRANDRADNQDRSQDTAPHSVPSIPFWPKLLALVVIAKPIRAKGHHRI
jgi:hypothetical protein